jgi:4-hydroxybenzoate polyprenyltransferase
MRYPNLLSLAFVQLVLRFGFLKFQNFSLALNDFQYFILVFATVAIAAAGYVINDVFDQETDEINRPQQRIVGVYISEKKAYNLYFFLNISGVVAGFIVSNIVGKPNFAALFIMIAASLYFYATTLKQTFLLGNILVAFLSFLSVLIVAFFDLYPTIDEQNRAIVSIFFKIILDYAIFAFLINFISEIVKDIQNIEGDLSEETSTMTINIRVFWSKVFVIGLSCIAIILLFWYVIKYYFDTKLYLATAFATIFLIAPFCMFVLKTINANSKSAFQKSSDILKFIIAASIVLIIIVTQNILYNA